MADPFDLQRFLAAQDANGSYGQALAELHDGHKRSHWMWFVFPQIAGLGRSQTARAFAISSIEEAKAYLEHPILGPRLRECAQVLAQAPGSSAEQILGGIDAVKLRSSMTLFMRADLAEPVFAEVLAKFFGGAPDPATDERI